MAPVQGAPDGQGVAVSGRGDRRRPRGLGHPKPGQIRGQRPPSSRMEPGAAGVSGRVEESGAESPFQPFRGLRRGLARAEQGQTPPCSRKQPSLVPSSRLRISLSLLWLSGADRTQRGLAPQRGRVWETPPPRYRVRHGEGGACSGAYSPSQPPSRGVAPIEIIPAGRLRGEPRWTTTRGAAFSAVSNASTGGQAIMGARCIPPF